MVLIADLRLGQGTIRAEKCFNVANFNDRAAAKFTRWKLLRPDVLLQRTKGNADHIGGFAWTDGKLVYSLPHACIVRSLHASA